MSVLHVITFLFMIRTVLGDDAEALENTSTQDTMRTHRNNTEFLSTTIAPPWVDSPNTRGTGDILFTYLLTLVACIYTAIHPHVPMGGSFRFLGFVRVSNLSLIKAVMAMEALIAPEMLLFGAITELIQARSLRSDLKQIISRRKKAGMSDPDEALIDNNLCYFVTMGGFRVSIEDVHPSRSAHLSSSSTHCLPSYLPLSPDGVRLLAELGHLSLLVEHAGDIDDRSKADTVQKCLAAGQLCWMVIQCIVRKAQGLPISLLEVHTFAHAFFSVLLYGVWLKKPLDITPSSRVFLPTKDFEDALALMVQEQFCEAHNIVACLYPERTPENEFSTIAVSGDPKTIPPFDKPGSPILMPVKNHDGDPMKVTWIDPTSPTSVPDPDRLGMVLPCGFGYAKLFAPPVTYLGWYSKRRADVFRAMTSPHRPNFLSHKDKLRAERAMRHIALLDGMPLQSPQPYVNCEDVRPKKRRCRYPTLKYRRAFYSREVVPRKKCLDMPAEFEGGDEPLSGGPFSYNAFIYSGKLTDAPLALPTFRVVANLYERWTNDNIGNTSLLMISALSGLNAGIHLAAWNYVFPSKIESQSWRAASFLSAVMGLAMVLGRLAISLLLKITEPHRRPARSTSIFMLEALSNLTMALLNNLVIIGRLYLNVEAFISPRHMPYGVYVMPSWLEVLPHL